jgi:acetyltransferase-like isoleucine patch superfamily enzyme
MFYSRAKQNGFSMSGKNKIEERKEINIGNDVFIGANVVVLDGVNIGDGAVIGAGAVVSKDIPPYAIAVGCPIQIKKYRFEKETINHLIKLKWWDWDFDRLKSVEDSFFDVETFLKNNP